MGESRGDVFEAGEERDDFIILELFTLRIDLRYGEYDLSCCGVVVNRMLMFAGVFSGVVRGVKSLVKSLVV